MGIFLLDFSNIEMFFSSMKNFDAASFNDFFYCLSHIAFRWIIFMVHFKHYVENLCVNCKTTQLYLPHVFELINLFAKCLMYAVHCVLSIVDLHLHKRTMINEIFTDPLNLKPLHQICYLRYK